MSETYTYENWLEAHRSQLDSQNVPASLWRRLFDKVVSSSYDAGAAFQFSFDSDEPQGCRYGLIATHDLPAESDIFLIDHMATFERPEEAASLLAQVPAVRKRVAELLEIEGLEDEGFCMVEENTATGELKAQPEKPAKQDSELVDEILPKLWIVTASYELEQTDGSGSAPPKPLFYIMDEVGSRLTPAPDPADAGFQVALIVDLRKGSDTTAFNVFWPVTDVGEGESCTARGLPNGRPKLNKMRSSFWGFEDEEIEGEENGQTSVVTSWATEYAEPCSKLATALRSNGYTAKNFLSLLSLPTDAVGFPAQNLSHPNARAQAVSVLSTALSSHKPELPNLLTLAKLFLLSLAVSLEEATTALGTDLVDFLLDQNAAFHPTPSTIQLLVQFAPLAPQNLLLATDFQQTAGGSVTGIFDPVMFIGVDSLGLSGLLYKDLSSQLQGKSVVDLCSGSGIQGLVAASLGCKRATMVDINPRAARFNRVNALLNSLSNCEILNGNLWDAVYSRTFDVILANPPYIPNPRRVVATLDLFGDGGTTGEEIVSRIFAGLSLHAERGALVVAVSNLVNPAEYGPKISKWTEGKFEGKVVFGKPWAADTYAQLIVELPASNPKVASYGAGLKAGGVKEIANGFVVGHVVDKGEVKAERGADEVWQVIAGIVIGQGERAATVAKLL